MYCYTLFISTSNFVSGVAGACLQTNFTLVLRRPFPIPSMDRNTKKWTQSMAGGAYRSSAYKKACDKRMKQIFHPFTYLISTFYEQTRSAQKN